jgi:hypothetical protein
MTQFVDAAQQPLVDEIKRLRDLLAQQQLADAFAEDFPNSWGKKKHTAPPSKPWVGLTDEEVKMIDERLSGSGVARAVEGLLKERNK